MHGIRFASAQLPPAKVGLDCKQAALNCGPADPSAQQLGEIVPHVFGPNIVRFNQTGLLINRRCSADEISAKVLEIAFVARDGMARSSRSIFQRGTKLFDLNNHGTRWPIKLPNLILSGLWYITISLVHRCSFFND